MISRFCIHRWLFIAIINFKNPVSVYNLRRGTSYEMLTGEPYLLNLHSEHCIFFRHLFGAHFSLYL